MNKKKNIHHHWKVSMLNAFVLAILLILIVLFVPIIWVDFFNQFYLGGAPLGFWFAMQGSIICIVILMFIYMWISDRLDKKDQLEDS